MNEENDIDFESKVMNPDSIVSQKHFTPFFRYRESS